MRWRKLLQYSSPADLWPLGWPDFSSDLCDILADLSADLWLLGWLLWPLGWHLTSRLTFVTSWPTSDFSADLCDRLAYLCDLLADICDLLANLCDLSANLWPSGWPLITSRLAISALTSTMVIPITVVLLHMSLPSLPAVTTELPLSHYHSCL